MPALQKWVASVCAAWPHEHSRTRGLVSQRLAEPERFER